ncbi:MAG: type II secretion system protein [Candidatus Omnitrophica bacterium]|nr:type II secretion system protein [Candidatus Omnitrophota bacterium]
MVFCAYGDILNKGIYYMDSRKGFTLIEILVVMIIIGITTSFALYSCNYQINKAIANATGKNLSMLAQAQQIFYLNHGYFCKTQEGDAHTFQNSTPALPNCQLLYPASTCGDNLLTLNCNLGLNIVDTNYTYRCSSDYSNCKDPLVQHFECAAMSNNQKEELYIKNFPEAYLNNIPNQIFCDYRSSCNNGAPCVTSAQYCPDTNVYPLGTVIP